MAAMPEVSGRRRIAMIIIFDLSVSKSEKMEQILPELYTGLRVARRPSCWPQLYWHVCGLSELCGQGAC